MPNDFVSATTVAATKLQEASRDSYTLILNASVANQEKASKLAKNYIEDAWTAGARNDTKLVDDLLANLKKGQEAGQELALSYFAASVATLFFPFAIAEQVFRPQAA
jgi:hypothetical protein